MVLWSIASSEKEWHTKKCFGEQLHNFLFISLIWPFYKQAKCWSQLGACRTQANIVLGFVVCCFRGFFVHGFCFLVFVVFGLLVFFFKLRERGAGDDMIFPVYFRNGEIFCGNPQWKCSVVQWCTITGSPPRPWGQGNTPPPDWGKVLSSIYSWLYTAEKLGNCGKGSSHSAVLYFYMLLLA